MAVYLVGAVILLQVVAVISVFFLRAMIVPVNFKPPVALQPKSGASTVRQLPVVPKPPNPGLTAPKLSNLPGVPSLTMTVPRPAMLSVPQVSDKLEQVGSLNDQAKIFQHQNDLKSAADTLIKAEDIDPRNPTTLKNLAETYYLMNDSVQAKIYWQRLVDLGPGVGTVYALAKDHVLLLGSTPEADPLRQPRCFHVSFTSMTRKRRRSKRPTGSRNFTCARSSCAKTPRCRRSTRKSCGPT